MSTGTINFQDAAALAGLAGIAEFDLTDLYLPQPWLLISTFEAKNGGPQGFIAQGQLPSTGSTTSWAVLVFGFGWADFVEMRQLSSRTLTGGPSGLLPVTQQGPAQCELNYTTFYGSIRAQLWQQLIAAQQSVPAFQSQMPLVIVGLGPSAPLAQLAALDFLPKRTWNQQTSPATQVTAYALSCPAFGNKAFATYYNTSVPNGFTINLATSQGVTVDFYPTGPDITQGYYPAGQAAGASARIQQPACPWTTRDAPYYVNMLNAAGNSNLVADAATSAPFRTPARRAFAAGFNAAQESPVLSSAPAGYNSVLAYTLSLLTATAYQRFEHPDLPSTSVPVPWLFYADVKSDDGVVWASIFVATQDKVCVAFRGSETSDDLVRAYGSNALSYPSWLTLDGQVLQGPEKLYSALRDDLKNKLAACTAGASLPVYFTGHDLGGNLASLAALDLSLNGMPNGMSLGGIYTFGAPPLGNTLFKSSFASNVGAKSYQIVRPADSIASLVFGTVYSAVRLDNAVQISGGDSDPNNGSTFHALVTYTALLNPTLGANFSMLSATLSSRADAHYQEGLKTAGIAWNDVHKCSLDTAQNGHDLVFSPDPTVSCVPPAALTKSGDGVGIGVGQVVVRPGAKMIVEAPRGEAVQVVMSHLVLSPGTEVHVNTQTRLHIGRLEVAAPAVGAPHSGVPSFVVVGVDGQNGTDGVSGSPAPEAPPGGIGGAGHYGGNGSNGGGGANAHQAIIHVQELAGTVNVIVRGGVGGKGGNGGAGGPGGAGGRLPGSPVIMPGGPGGPGGNGGNGGKGGDGSTVYFTFSHAETGSIVNTDITAALGGAGGAGGPGGAVGNGSPRISPQGATGRIGIAGNPGRQGDVIVRQSNT